MIFQFANPYITRAYNTPPFMDSTEADEIQFWPPKMHRSNTKSGFPVETCNKKRWNIRRINPHFRW